MIWEPVEKNLWRAKLLDGWIVKCAMHPLEVGHIMFVEDRRGEWDPKEDLRRYRSRMENNNADL